MWPFRRHEDVSAQSPEQPDTAVISAEAAKALRRADEVQREATRRAAQLEPLMRAIRIHLAENDVVRTVGANYVRRNSP